MGSARLEIAGKSYDLPIFVGSQGEVGLDIQKLRGESGCITFDPGYGNTGSCESSITFIDGEQGILRYRGYPIEELAQKSNFLETAYLIIHGELPTAEQDSHFRQQMGRCAALHESMQAVLKGVPASASPMAVLSALLNNLGCHHPELANNDRETELAHIDTLITLLISKVRTLAALTYRKKNGLPVIYPKPDLDYVQNFLHMFFSEPYNDYVATPEVTRALDLILLLHADHEQNCSTSTVRMVGSGGANLFASVSAGVSALWGPLHGGANVAVLNMLEAIHRRGDDGSRFIEEAKDGQHRLMGFGHRVYKNYDPRAKILKEACAKVLDQLHIDDPLLSIAQRLESQALEDPYFIERKLYPNVDFYSGIILRAIGIPVEFFTVMFAIGRLPGWIANWLELARQNSRIYRPRQIYTGPPLRSLDRQ